ncbi:MAG: hypothetical protein JW765_05795 [Deltaproteobacteria bacterium]|nr:hypothetical protein [Candidatus Zymogenaceae bacterium]
MKKIILSGLLAGVAMLAVGFGAGYGLMAIFPKLAAEYANTALFRPWSDPIMSLYFAHPFALGFILAWIWNKVKGVIGGAGWAARGARFGLAYWAVSIPGMIISYASFPLSLVMVVTWSVSILLQALAAGLILAAINR